jgi:uncharacterized membrane protein YebE (DUF533 family)
MFDANKLLGQVLNSGATGGIAAGLVGGGALLQELSRPVDMDSLVRAAKTPEMASEVYAASLMAIDVSNQAESAYLQMLASRLGLDPALVAELQRTVAEDLGTMETALV